MNLMKRNHLDDLRIKGRIILDWFLKKCGRRVWIGFIRLWIKTSGWLL
jgi:hypothetical protein